MRDMTRDPIYHNLVTALPRPGCAICRLAREKVHGYLDALLYENINDAGVRAQLRGAHGFCHRHAWEAAALRDALGLAILYRDVVTAIGKEVKHARSGGRAPLRRLLRQDAPPPGQTALQRLTPARPCPACTVETDVADTCLGMLAKHLGQAEMAQAFSASHGLCLPHLRRALALTDDQDVIHTLLAKEGVVIDGLVGELSEFIRKHDYRFRHEGFGAERDA